MFINIKQVPNTTDCKVHGCIYEIQTVSWKLFTTNYIKTAYRH